MNLFKIKGKRKRKLSRSKKIALGIGIFLLAIVLTITGIYLHIYKKIYVASNNNPYGDEVDLSDVEIDAPLYNEVKGITNILLIGIDARDSKEPSRSDAMIILTIDSNNEKVKLTSIMRDSYVDIPKYKTAKINAAFANGGPQLLMKTIEANFRIKLDKYIVVDFHGFEDIIDAVGGIEVDVSESERKELNKYIGETREVKSPPLTKAGYQKLDGQQALVYSRIRYNDSDYRRTERQREVLSILANKLLKTSVVNYPKVMNSILNCVTTNIKPEMLLNYAYTVSKFDNLHIEQLQMPMTELSWGGYYKGEWLLLLDKEQNAKVMNDFIFIDKEPNVDELDLEAAKAIIDGYLGRSVATEKGSKEPVSNNKGTTTGNKGISTDNKDKTTTNTPTKPVNNQKDNIDTGKTSPSTNNPNTDKKETPVVDDNTGTNEPKDNNSGGGQEVPPKEPDGGNGDSDINVPDSNEGEQREDKNSGQPPLG